MISVPAALAIVSVVAVLTLGSPVKYDQRQEGDLNVRTDVEDVVFVVVPPKDLINAGMGLVAATAADLLRKNYGGFGVERWPQRTSSKLGFVPLEKSPYKLDLERSEVQVKKISQAGDPNRYNIHEGKPPVKLEQVALENTSNVPIQQTTEHPVVVTEKLDAMVSSTEGKTVKKDLKEEIMKEDMKTDNTENAKLEKQTQPEVEMKKTETKLEKKSKPETDLKKPESLSEKHAEPQVDMKTSESKLEKISKPEMDLMIPQSASQKKSKPEMDTKKTDLVSEKKSKPVETEMKKSEGTTTPEVLKVIGDFSEEPASIFRLEGCGPDAYRDSTGKCVIKTTEKVSN